MRVTFELSAETWGLLERALEGARRCARAKRSDETGRDATGADTKGADTAGADTSSDADALAAVARDALSAQHQDPDASDPRCSVVVYECESCGKSELETGVGPLELEPASAAAPCCGKSEVHLATEGRVVKRGGPLPAALRRAVMQSDGGQHSRENCLLLCTTHHHLLHDGKLELSGDAEGELCFRHAEGHWLGGEADLAGVSPIAERPTGTDVETMTQRGASSHGPAARVLHAIGRRGGWSLDALIEKLELPAQVVASALTELELGGSIRHRDFAYHPV